MTKRYRRADLSPEDRQTFDAWIRAVALFYGLAVLVLIGTIAARALLSEPTTATGPAATHGSADRSISGGETFGKHRMEQFLALARSCQPHHLPDGVPSPSARVLHTNGAPR